MTTPKAAANYLAEHMSVWGDKGFAVYNPHDLPVDDLPIIFGFNNGGGNEWYYAQLIASDGMGMGTHICSHPSYMPHDLGIVESSRPDRHEGFRERFPRGYKMEFVDVHDPRLKEAYRLNQQLAKEAKGDPKTD